MTKYVRMSLKGGLGPTEVWSVNFVLDPEGEVGFDFDQANFDAFTANVGAIVIPTELKKAMSSAASLRSVRAELRDTDSDGFIGASEFTLATPQVGSSTAACPLQTSVVASLRSGSALASGRGRLYWPGLGLAISGGTMRLTATNTAALASDFSSYLTNIRNQAKSSLTPVSLVNFGLSIYSPTRRILTPVTSIRVGDVPDVQRRRRDAMAEQYSSKAFPFVA